MKETLKDKRETWSGQMYVSVWLVGLVGSLVGWFVGWLVGWLIGWLVWSVCFFLIMVYLSYHGIIEIIIWNRCMAGGILRTANVDDELLVGLFWSRSSLYEDFVISW